MVVPVSADGTLPRIGGTMTAEGAMSVVARNSGGGVQLELELQRGDLLPGRLVPGVLRVLSGSPCEIRGAFVTLVGTEHWKHEVTERDAKGNMRTRIVREERELPRVPVQVLGPVALGRDERRELPFEIPVPGLGPASVAADVCGVEWTLEAKLDVPGFDPGVAMPVTIHQPTALLRAGVVPVGQFALWPSADAGADGIRASISVDPVPLDLGGPFRGRLVLETDGPYEVQEVRVELRVHAEATVSSGLREEITIWTAQVLGAGRLSPGVHDIEFAGDLPAVALPTAALPHGRTNARLHVIIARARARDPHLVRDVALATTTEV